MSDDKTNRAAEIESAIRRSDSDNAMTERLDKMLACMDSLSKGLEGFGARLDALETAGKPGASGVGDMPGTPVKVAADANAAIDPYSNETLAELSDAQARADDVASVFGESAPRPLSGELPLAYRQRLLKRFQHHSKQFKTVDLTSVTDPVTFGGIEASIYADAVAAGATPDVLPGRLHGRSRRTESGHTITDFFGSPSAWLNRFGGSRKAVTAIVGARGD